MGDLQFLSAVELTRLLRDREVSSVELLDHFLDRVERYNPDINAIVAFDIDRAKRRAIEADRALARGEVQGPLLGLPMTVKDAFETEGVVTTSGAPRLRDHRPETDAVAVARLRAAGAIIFGKTNLPLYAGDLQTFNKVYGRTNNPWDLGRTPGGSSGGSAAALAAGLTGFELGSDLGGSIRHPAHCCGVFGLKVSWGTVPQRGHVPGPPGTLAPYDVGVVGPMGRSAADLALGLDVLAGPDDDAGVGWQLELPPARNHGAIAGLRIGIWFEDPASPVAGEVRELLDQAAAALADDGAKIEPVDPPIGLGKLAHLWVQLVMPVIAAGVSDETFASLREVAMSPDALSEDPAGAGVRAMTETHRTWLQANERRHGYRAAFAELFRSYDVLLAPVTGLPAFPHDTDRDLNARTLDVDGISVHHVESLKWCSGIGTLLAPVVSAPVGRTPTGLPVGIQVVAPYLEDRTAIAVAGHLERLLGGFAPPPAFA